ncbi:MAG: bifunctional DNA primase/polymerase [Pseudonocardiaceae bacterium]
MPQTATGYRELPGQAGGVYGHGAPIYRQLGWAGVLPLPERKKLKPPDGCTGRAGTDPTSEQIQRWVIEQSCGNIGLRMPEIVIGIDVDSYDGKLGGATLAELEARLGKLPATYRSSSRDNDPVSGIRFFRIPAGLHFHDAGLHVETIQRTYRYAVVWPSVHPSGGIYRWYDPRGVVAISPPRPEDFPELPPAWVDCLTTRQAPALNGEQRPLMDPIFEQANERKFTREQAWENCRPHLERLANAVDGEINNRLNNAAKFLSHFGEEFWLWERAEQALLDALAHTAYDEATWHAESTIASAYSSRGRDWTATLVEPQVAAMAVTSQSSGGLNLSDDFWSARPLLAHARAAAHSRAVSADVVIGVLLPRLSSLVPGRLRVDTGVCSPTPLSYYSILFGASGSTKSSSTVVADELLLGALPEMARAVIDNDSYPLSTGPGIAASYGETNSDGVFQQTRDRAFFHLDEAGSLFTTDRHNSQAMATLETLRKAWSGGTFGQQNATQALRRRVRDYTIGLWVVLQHAHAVSLLSGNNLTDGTLQRFVWFPARSPAIPYETVADPGPLGLDMNFVNGLTQMTVPQWLKAELRADLVARNRGDLIVEPGDEHRNLLRVRTACLLAILDHRTEVNTEDWELAGQILAVSSAQIAEVRRSAASNRLAVESQRTETRHRALDADERRAEQRAAEKAEKLVAKVVEKVKAEPGVAESTLIRKFSDRQAAETAIITAQERGLIVIEPSDRGGGHSVRPK